MQTTLAQAVQARPFVARAAQAPRRLLVVAAAKPQQQAAAK